MKSTSFYTSSLYKERQSFITKTNWKKGVYDSLRKREKRQCARIGCGRIFEVKQSDSKKFCSRHCAAKVNNLKRFKADLGLIKKIKELYKKELSMKEVAEKLGCSEHKVDYWMNKRNIPKRSRSEATYVKRNPDGDPFRIKKLKSKKDFELLHLGIGLYLGEGDKKSKHVVKVANSDPKILKIFLNFLREIYGVKESKIGAELNIFNDVDLGTALGYWARNLGLKRSQFKTLTVRESRGGSYKNKSKYGTLSIYVTNVKLKELMNRWCEQATERC